MLEDFKRRARFVMNGESGAGILEAAVLIAVFIIIAYFFIRFLKETIETAQTHFGYSSGTGWFRTEDVDGIKQP